MTDISKLIEEALESCEAAHRHICDLAEGKKKWKMCIPVKKTDSDLVLQAPLDFIPKLIDELERRERSINRLKDVVSIVDAILKGED